ncbi:hypothetical protein PAXRUDRAFT_832978 [Paxillus rubicundulus Ve08.2h10]|uniref:Dynamin GTPase n=1 Tax=Paxillus rubicundulus Ve08.2h10 TaxID=930991 RepID=A0A0D0DB34_9AGAM|nr:hypothetical protein PAXRUDRAFT_832978 [Paxillus rubicundulus Ve08.2h10]
MPIPNLPSPVVSFTLDTVDPQATPPSDVASMSSDEITGESIGSHGGFTFRFGSPVVTADNNNVEGVGLSDPTKNYNRKEMLDLVNRLRNTGVQTDIDLPLIAVIGSQSAGKSSLIESISGITLPRSSGTCTRCPTECKLSHSDSPWKCIVKLHFSTNPKGASIPVRLVPFGDPITSKSLVEDRIRRAQRAILNPSVDPKKYLHGKTASNENELSFSKNYVSLEISGKDLADLSFVDLPGLIASVGRAGDERDIELVKSLVTSYIKKDSCVILLTVACETDFENQGAHHLAKKYDPEGKRTVGVLTKPDRIQPGDESSWLRILRNETESLLNNWYCVKQPQTLSLGITWADARRQETDFFATAQPWGSLEPRYQKFLGTGNLTERLSLILSELIAKRLPEIQKELMNSLQETEAELRALPRAPSSDPVGEVLHVLSNFTRDLSRRLEGTSEEDGLLQTIRPCQETFKRAIRRTAPNFVPWENTQSARELPKAEFLANEEGDDEGTVIESDGGSPSLPHLGSVEKSLPTDQIYIDEVFKRAQSARTRELPDNYPFVVQKEYIKQFTKQWRQPAMDLFDNIHAILKADLAKLVKKHFAEMGKGNAEQSILMIVYDHLDGAAARTKERIEWLLALEQSPTTLNTHYYSDYKDKFLAYYKGFRDNTDLASRIKTFQSSNKVVPGFQGAIESRLNPITQILAGLSAIGITVKAEDLPRLLSSDPMEAALNIMASVRAYFQVAYKRFADMVPIAVDYEIVLGLEKNIDKALQEGLQITGPDGYSRCQNMLQELSSVASRRQDMQKKLERLQAARQELKRLM